MKQISDDQWEKIFLAERRQQENKEREFFEKALLEGVGELQSDEIAPSLADNPEKLERKIHKSISPEIDATLNLHLKKKNEATMELCGFFQQAADAGDRMLLVITGKGHHSERKGVLREHVRQWIKAEGRHWVLWFAEAPRKLGGSGAWLIRLKP
ncbi:MAG: Smr/MutS family protein [Holophagae bacterium]|nr:Smr/MutS family protein [Holophagae bacterium]